MILSVPPNTAPPPPPSPFPCPRALAWGPAGTRGGSREGGRLRRSGWKPSRAPARRERSSSYRAARVHRRSRSRPGVGRVVYAPVSHAVGWLGWLAGRVCRVGVESFADGKDGPDGPCFTSFWLISVVRKVLRGTGCLFSVFVACSQDLRE